MATLQAAFDPPPDSSPEDLRNRLRALAELLARAPVPIAVAHDRDCRLISANDALARLLGVEPGANISLTPPPGQQPRYRIQRAGRDLPAGELPMQASMAQRTRISNDIEIVRPDGAVRYVQNDVEPLYDSAGEVCGCISVCVDVTDRKRTADGLRDADRRKDEFLATLSHELRNPLAPIRNALELLRRPAATPAAKEQALTIMGRQLQQLVRLTDDLLDVSRISRDRLDLRPETIDLRAVVHSAIETTQPLLDAAGHWLGVEMPDRPVCVHGDFTRLAQVFANLLNNAVKYTDRGGQVQIAVTATGENAKVIVRDSGIGIEPELLPRIFDLFTQLDASSEGGRSGLGIGLTLARRLIALHGGTIDADSQGRGTGTTFTTTLPLVHATAADIDAALRREPENRSCRVLIAEDIPDAAEMLRMMIEFMGHTVHVAADGVQAVAMAKEFKPRIAVLDIGMPRMDGLEAARQIRAALGDDIVLVALTGWGQEDDQRRAREAGFDRHLTKPAEPDVLEDLITAAAQR